MRGFDCMNREQYILSQFPGRTFNASGKLHTRCPFHEDSSPSFSITTEGLFICGSASCGVRGNFALFYKMSEGIASWAEVKAKLGEVAPSATLDIATLYSPVPASVEGASINSFPVNVEPIGSLQYFVDRSFTDEEIKTLCERFGLTYGYEGYHDGIQIEGTIVVPVYDLDGQYRTFQVRYLDPERRQRWKNPLNSPNQDLLYGGWLISGAQPVWVVEGASDVWNLARFGYEAVGIFTKETTVKQRAALLELGQKFGIPFLVCLDGDTHSQSFGFGADSGAALQHELRAFGLEARVLYLQKGQDPGNMTAAELSLLVSEVSDDDSSF